MQVERWENGTDISRDINAMLSARLSVQIPPGAGFSLVYDAIPKPVTATGGGASIAAGTTFADITSTDQDDITRLPPAIAGRRVSGYVGANGCQLRTSASPQTINGNAADAVDAFPLPANTGFVAESFDGVDWQISRSYRGLDAQDLVDACLQTRDVCQFPGGLIELPASLDFRNKSGGKFIGVGQQASYNPAYSYNGASTQFWWSGSDGESVMIVQGGEKYFADFIIHPDEHDGVSESGDYFWDANGNVPKCAIEMRHNASPNLGTGDFVFERITIEGFPIGILLGDYALVRQQSDESTFNNISFDTCDIGFQLDHLQVLGHHFRNIKWRKGAAGRVFNLRGGGKMVVDNVQLSHGGTCLYFDPANTDQFGQNTYDYRLSMIRADLAASYSFMFFDSNPATVGSMAANIVINGGGPQAETYAANNARIGMLYGRQRATLRDIIQLQLGHFGWDNTASPTHTPSLTLENCVFASATTISTADEVLATTGNTGQLLFRAINCRDWSGTYLPDIGATAPVLYDADGTPA